MTTTTTTTQHKDIFGETKKDVPRERFACGVGVNSTDAVPEPEPEEPIFKVDGAGLLLLPEIGVDDSAPLAPLAPLPLERIDPAAVVGPFAGEPCPFPSFAPAADAGDAAAEGPLPLPTLDADDLVGVSGGSAA